MTEEISDPLKTLGDEIEQCRVCEGFVAGFKKPPRLDRGSGGRIMIIGQGPGNAEIKRRRAFAGQSGRTLDAWLVSAGADPRDPRKGIYLTSVIKCCHSRIADFQLMARERSRFLDRQLRIVCPALVITLGRLAFDNFKFTPGDYEESLCKPVHSKGWLLFPSYGVHFWLLPWPHPSGLNRWHNSETNRARLNNSLSFVRQVMEGRSGE